MISSSTPWTEFKFGFLSNLAESRPPSRNSGIYGGINGCSKGEEEEEEGRWTRMERWVDEGERRSSKRWTNCTVYPPRSTVIRCKWNCGT